MRLVIAVPVVPETGGRVSARIVSVRRSRGFAGGFVVTGAQLAPLACVQ
jgi:hypothetical protein